MIKTTIIGTTLIASIASANEYGIENGTYSGTAHYEKKNFFGKESMNYAISIYITDNSIILSLPKSDCKSKLHLVSNNIDSFTFKEEQLEGLCEVDINPTTIIKFEDRKLYYKWRKNSKEKSTAVLTQD